MITLEINVIGYEYGYSKNQCNGIRLITLKIDEIEYKYDYCKKYRDCFLSQ